MAGWKALKGVLGWTGVLGSPAAALRGALGVVWTHAQHSFLGEPADQKHPAADEMHWLPARASSTELCTRRSCSLWTSCSMPGTQRMMAVQGCQHSVQPMHAGPTVELQRDCSAGHAQPAQSARPVCSLLSLQSTQLSCMAKKGPQQQARACSRCCTPSMDLQYLYAGSSWPDSALQHQRSFLTGMDSPNKLPG